MSTEEGELPNFSAEATPRREGSLYSRRWALLRLFWFVVGRRVGPLCLIVTSALRRLMLF